MLKRVMSSWNKSTAKNKSTDCVQSHPANAKPDVARSQSLARKVKFIKEVIAYLFSDDCPVETKSLAYSHALAILLSFVALPVSLLGLFYSLKLL